MPNEITYVKTTKAQDAAFEKEWKAALEFERDTFKRHITDTAKVKIGYANAIWNRYKVRIADQNVTLIATEFSAIAKALDINDVPGGMYRGRSVIALREDYVCLRGETDIAKAINAYRAENGNAEPTSLQKVIPFIRKETNKRKVNYKPRESGAAQSQTVKDRAALRIAYGKFGEFGSFENKAGKFKATQEQSAKITATMREAGVDINDIRAMDVKDIRLVIEAMNGAIRSVEKIGRIPNTKGAKPAPIAAKVNASKAAPKAK